MANDKLAGHLSQSRELEIADLAAFIADEYAPASEIDPAGIAKKKGITLSFNHYGTSFDGMLEHRAGRFHIYCNLGRVARRDSTRARFTIGHELGHYFIDEHRNALSKGLAPAHPSKIEYESVLEVEREADVFASNLLMPHQRFLTKSGKVPAGLRGILDLAAHFNASVTSVAVRYVKADIMPCAVIKWGPEGFQWKWLSTETWRANFRKTVESIEKLPLDCSTAKALRGDPVPEKGFFESGTTAAAWFPFISSNDYRNHIFMEQAVPLGRFGVLSFIYPLEGLVR